MSKPTTCPLCKSEAVEEWGESGTFWLHCNGCGVDDPFIKAAGKALRETGEVGLGLFSDIPKSHYERVLTALTHELGELRVHLIPPPQD